MMPDINVSLNQNGTYLVVFTPSESGWKFPNGKKLRLFNILHAIVTPQEIPYSQSENMEFDEAIEFEATKAKNKKEPTAIIQEIIAEWISNGDLIIE